MFSRGPGHDQPASPHLQRVPPLATSAPNTRVTHDQNKVSRDAFETPPVRGRHRLPVRADQQKCSTAVWNKILDLVVYPSKFSAAFGVETQSFQGWTRSASGRKQQAGRAHEDVAYCRRKHCRRPKES